MRIVNFRLLGRIMYYAFSVHPFHEPYLELLTIIFPVGKKACNIHAVDRKWTYERTAHNTVDSEIAR